METIKNYLEAMFANMPRTADVEKAKSELLQMMEDKYNELISEGKTENEAVGTVISEFGNLDELAEALGLEKEVQQEHEESEANPRRALALEEIRDYLQYASVRALCIALGVALCIISATGPILFDTIHLAGVGVLVLLLLVAGAVLLFVFSGITSKKWSYITKGSCYLDYAGSNYTMEEKGRYRRSFAARLTLGIILCAICWLPMVIADSLGNLAGLGEVFQIIVLLGMIAAGVFLIIHSSMIMGSINDLLKINDGQTMSSSYTEKAFPHYDNPKADGLLSIYWPTVRSIYLIWSFLTFAWWRTWIIWPVAGIVYAIIKSLFKSDNPTQGNSQV
ncbi:MAG: hypothetical protein IKR23_04730 [Lachnospiraceae bacterium]|nr:hypothetical protein [Lachnospiraceae bacterium]